MHHSILNSNRVVRLHETHRHRLKKFAVWRASTALCGVPVLLVAMQIFLCPFVEAQGNQAEETARPGEVGAPQVLEIPSTVVDGGGEESTNQRMTGRTDWDELPLDTEGWRRSTSSRRPFEVGRTEDERGQGIESQKRTYLGVLFATAEEGPEGVRVLNVIDGSPADRAGFVGVNSPARDKKSDLMKAAIVVLAMSPAGPFVMPLAIAHDIYKNRHPPGDLIVEVGGTIVRTAQEFTTTMQNYKPGERVSFKVHRNGKLLLITVALEQEPL